MELSRRDILQLAGGAGALGAVGAVQGSGADHETPAALPDRRPPEAYEDYRVLEVPEDHDTIQAAVDAAEPRDLVLVGAGVYTEAVTVIDTPDLTIRGRDRNEVILDGEFTRENGVTATVDGVVVENMTARHYSYNGFYWTGVDGYRGSYLTAYNNGDYGVYAFDSVNGRFDNCYASGHPDSGFYVGQCNPCHAVVENVVSENNALGYSGTNAGGDLLIRGSVWRHNMAGIVPNTLDSEDLAPQSAVRIENNEVYANNNADAPAKAYGYPPFGTGISVVGGTDNEIVNNEVRDHVNFGIAVVPSVDRSLWPPKRNTVWNNQVEHSGRADLALGAPTGEDNRFSSNDADSARPAGLDGGGLLAGAGDLWVTLLMGKAYLQTELGDFPRGDWKDQPEPPDQTPMPDTEHPPRPPVGERRDA